MRKTLVILFSALILVLNPVSVFAEESNQDDNSVREVYEPVGDPNAKYTFYDKEAAKSTITPQAGERRVYKNSYYQVASQKVTAYNVGPREKDKFLISVAKGVNKTITGNLTITGSVTYSGSVSAEIRQIINASLTAEVSGSISYQWSKSTQYSGPTGNYTTRDYYGAINYDKYSTVVKKYNVYDLYLGNTREGQATELASTTNVDGVKKPKVVDYYRDYNN